MKKYITKIIEIRRETEDTKTFCLESLEPLAFLPGQYCLVSIPSHAQFSKTTKPFTFSHSPLNHQSHDIASVNTNASLATHSTTYLELTVKRMGFFTQALFTLQIGDALLIKGPMGDKLNFSDKIQSPIVFLAGGSGITPFMSIIRYCIAKKLPNPITLLYGNRSKEDIIFEHELAKLASPTVQVINILESPPQHWQGETGRITQDLITKYTKDYNNKLWYVCGPPRMVESMKKILTTLQIPEEQWYIEPWELPGKQDT